VVTSLVVVAVKDWVCLSVDVTPGAVVVEAGWILKLIVVDVAVRSKVDICVVV
jgi:hypothetical protein